MPFVKPVYAVTKITSGVVSGCQVIGDVPSLACLAVVVANVVQAALLFVGAAALFFLLFAAAQMIISRGDPKGLQKARGTATWALLGALLIFGAYFAITFVTEMFHLPNILRNFSFFQ